MKQVASQALASNREVSPSVRLLLRELAALGGLDVKSALALHGRGAAALAARLDKEVGQVAVEGDATSLAPEIYGPFLRSLVHVFRNAVDHGIETPDARLSSGKPAEGSIRCTVRHDDSGLKIGIEDDGCGVDRETLEARLTASGMPLSQAAGMSLENMMFREGLSSRDNADEISGRGVGLAAVKAELDRLGGSVSVETGQGAGTRLCFHVPANPKLIGHNSASLEMIP
jgi:chemotaxis protein histidine kinase CheA